MRQDHKQPITESSDFADQSNEFASVIILNYNGREMLGGILDECVNSVLKASYPQFEVLFVDNASTDDSTEYIQHRFCGDERLKIIRNERNLGFTEGNNRGIRQAKGKYIALLNSDTRVEPNWLTELVKALQTVDVGAAQSKLIRMDAPDELDCAGGFIDYYGYHLERGRGKSPKGYNRTDEVFYAKGASAIFKREALQKTGLFDPDIFMYFDEVDLCWRVWLAGYRVLYVPLSVVYHQSGSTTTQMQSAWRQYMYARNHLMVLLKNYGLANATRAAKVSMLFEARNFVLMLARRRQQTAFAILKAVTWNLRNFKETWSKRQTVQSIVRRVPDGEVQKRMLKPVPPFPYYVVRPRSKY